MKGKYRKMAAVLILGVLCLLFGMTVSAASVNQIRTAQQISGGKWIADEAGLRYRMKNGTFVQNKWVRIAGNIYYFRTDRYVSTGWFIYRGEEYYADSSGKVSVKKWIRYSGKTYYSKKNGICACSEWVKIGKKYYYFDYSGELAVDRWIGKTYYVGSDGARKTNCIVDGQYLDATGKNTGKISNVKYLFVGDSRTYYMSQAVSSEDTVFIARRGTGLLWLQSTAGKTVRNYLKQNPNIKVVFAFGVNDLKKYPQYITYYTKLISEYPDTVFRFLSVNPLDEQKKGIYRPGHCSSTEKILEFNRAIKAAFPREYLDSYSFLISNGFSSYDGLHYTDVTSRKLYHYIKQRL